MELLKIALLIVGEEEVIIGYGFDVFHDRFQLFWKLCDIDIHFLGV